MKPNMNIKEIERIVRVEQKTDDLTGKIDEIKSDVKEIKGFMAGMDGHYIGRVEFSDFKRSQTWQKILIMLGALLMGALITYFFTHVGGR